MKNKLTGICCYVISLCAILILFITSIDMNCFNRDFFASEYASMQTAQSLHMSHEDLMKATNVLLDYLQDERTDIIAEIEVYELPRQAFNERETLHMVDVKALYQWALQLRMGAIVVLLLSLSYTVFHKRKDSMEMLAKAFSQTALCFLAFVLFLGLWAAVDFTSLWESFHHLFFTNDLWLLNPRTDLMINMFPEDFFFHMVLRITSMFLITFGILCTISICYLQKQYHFISLKKRKGVHNEKNHFSK